MDEITLLRSVREDVEPARPEAVASGHRALAERTGSRRPSRRHRVGWTVGIATAACGVTALLVLTDVVGLAGWRGGADPAAAAVLDDAAVQTIHASDPVVGPGQYLRIATDAVYSSTNDAGTYLGTQNGQVYIPARRSDDWVWVRDPETVARTFGAASERAARESEPGGAEIVRAPGGAFYNGTPADDGLAGLPRDATRLLNHIYRVTLGAGPSRDSEALVFIADTLRTGDVPADLRAALYRAAAMIPGVAVVDRTANLDGRTGIAIGRDEPANGIRQEIIVDPSDGSLIGEEEVLTRAQMGLPAGTPVGWTAVTTTVVDSAPTGGTLCGTGMVPVGRIGGGECGPQG